MQLRSNNIQFFVNQPVRIGIPISLVAIIVFNFYLKRGNKTREMKVKIEFIYNFKQEMPTKKQLHIEKNKLC